VLIDWFTVVAQIVNFLVLVVLAKRFLYGPLIAAIDAREESLAARLAEAARSEREAAALAEKAVKNAAETEQEKAGVLAAAQQEADRRRGEILAGARDEATSLESRWRDELEREKSEFISEVRRRAAAEILDVTRSALRDLASADVDRCAVNTVIGRMGSLDPALLRAFAAHGVAIVSRAPLPEELRQSIRCALEERLGAPALITFETAPAMAWGIDLRGEGQRIGWTPDAYLDALENKLRVALDEAVAAIQPLAA
jgi:F-type H+-transporting ATPase subunit b